MHSKHLFAVTGWLIALLAAGMAAQAVFYLQQAGYADLWPQVMWNTSSIISDGSIFGKTLHTLVGYTAQPTLLQLVVYLATLGIIFTLMRLFIKDFYAPTMDVLRRRSCFDYRFPCLCRLQGIFAACGKRHGRNRNQKPF
jgi:high-affinity Fe2+/Pb2+ permease